MQYRGVGFALVNDPRAGCGPRIAGVTPMIDCAASGPFTRLDGIPPTALAPVATGPVEICHPVHELVRVRSSRHHRPVSGFVSGPCSSPNRRWSPPRLDQPPVALHPPERRDRLRTRLPSVPPRPQGSTAPAKHPDPGNDIDQSGQPPTLDSCANRHLADSLKT